MSGARVTQEVLQAAAVGESSLLPEGPLGADDAVLELRLYFGKALLAMNHYRKPKQVTLGEEDGADIFLASDGLPEAPFALLRSVDDELVLRLCPGMEGEIGEGKESQTLVQLKGAGRKGRGADDGEGTFELPLSTKMRALLHWGGATLALRFVPPPEVVPVGLRQSLDWHFLNASLLSWAGHLLLLTTLVLAAHRHDELPIDLFARPNRMAQLIVAPPPPTPASVAALKRMQHEVAVARPAASKQSQPSHAHASKSPRPAGAKRAPAPQASVAASFRDLLTGGRQGGAGAVLGGGGGGSLAGAAQNVIATEGAASAKGGIAGLGVRGSGPLTGGGEGSSRGIAGIGTAGRLGGGSRGYGGGVGLGSQKGHAVVALEVPQIEGALAPEVIKKVIDANRRQIQACYEEALQRQPELAGRVVVGWEIGGDGHVTTARVRESSLQSRPVEQCMLRHIRTWRFPAPAGGGSVQVNYPFVFRAS